MCGTILNTMNQKLLIKQLCKLPTSIPNAIVRTPQNMFGTDAYSFMPSYIRTLASQMTLATLGSFTTNSPAI